MTQRIDPPATFNPRPRTRRSSSARSEWLDVLFGVTPRAVGVLEKTRTEHHVPGVRHFSAEGKTYPLEKAKAVAAELRQRERMTWQDDE